jgi:hypothetical protein
MQVCNDVAHFLVRQGSPGPDLLRIRLPKIRPARKDDGPQTLIAHQGKVTGVGNPLLPLLMARGAVHLEELVALLNGPDGARRIWRYAGHLLIRASPSRPHPKNERIDLLRGEKSAS